MKVKEAIFEANKAMATWTEEDLKTFAFDRLVNELMRQPSKEEKNGLLEKIISPG